MPNSAIIASSKHHRHITPQNNPFLKLLFPGNCWTPGLPTCTKKLLEN